MSLSLFSGGRTPNVGGNAIKEAYLGSQLVYQADNGLYMVKDGEYQNGVTLAKTSMASWSKRTGYFECYASAGNYTALSNPIINGSSKSYTQIKALGYNYLNIDVTYYELQYDNYIRIRGYTVQSPNLAQSTYRLFNYYQYKQTRTREIVKIALTGTSTVLNGKYLTLSISSDDGDGTSAGGVRIFYFHNIYFTKE